MEALCRSGAHGALTMQSPDMDFCELVSYVEYSFCEFVRYVELGLELLELLLLLLLLVVVVVLLFVVLLLRLLNIQGETVFPLAC